MGGNETVRRWVDDAARLCRPDDVVWCDGSEDERERLTQAAVRAGELLPLDQQKLPGCYLHRSAPNDVARTEHLTFICSREKDDAGPTNNWMAPAEGYDRLGKVLDGSMAGRTMYVIPFLMGPPGSPFSRVGVQVTDSRYVVLNMRIMTRMGRVALDHLGESDDFTRCLHSTADLDVERRFICHFPDDSTIWSVGSGYGGNALLSKKCMALRIASDVGRREGWLAEHMLIVGIESPDGEITYVCGAFPSACGKTNLAMLVPPPSMKGWKIHTVGDDIAWLRPGPDGRLWAVNPENGFFGVVPGTNSQTNRNATDDDPARHDLHERRAPARRHGVVGRARRPAARLGDRLARPAVDAPERRGRGASEQPLHGAGRRAARRSRRSGRRPRACRSARSSSARAAAPSSRSCSSPSTGSTARSSARRSRPRPRRRPPARSAWCAAIRWRCSRSAATTWPTTGGTGSRWGSGCPRPPKIFRVNWFRRDAEGRFLWPGFGENLRVLEWIVERCRDSGKAEETPIGYRPAPGAIPTHGLDLAPGAMAELLHVDREGWQANHRSQAEFFQKFGDRLPRGIRAEWEALGSRLRAR